MGTNVLSWSQALRMGHQPAFYPFIATLVPTGEFEAVLDFKVWAKKTMGICCYFTQTKNGKKISADRVPQERVMKDTCSMAVRLISVLVMWLVFTGFGLMSTAKGK